MVTKNQKDKDLKDYPRSGGPALRPDHPAGTFKTKSGQRRFGRPSDSFLAKQPRLVFNVSL